MDLIDRIRELAQQVPKLIEHVEGNEEATKNALIMPFINLLGYNVFDPTEVVPEFTADVGTKRGEKVDYAILHDGEPAILFECKAHGANLSKVHASQLYRYFSVTAARFGILTNGTVYHFYTDLDAPNKMDEKPFLVFDLLDFQDAVVAELKRFTKSAFDVDEIVSIAGELKYTREIRRVVSEQFDAPNEEFARFFASQVYSGRMTQSVIEQFSAITRQALKQFVNDRVNARLQSALAGCQEPGNNEAGVCAKNAADGCTQSAASRVTENAAGEVGKSAAGGCTQNAADSETPERQVPSRPKRQSRSGGGIWPTGEKQPWIYENCYALYKQVKATGPCTGQ